MRFCCEFFICWALPLSGVPQEEPKPADFASQVWPILRDRCIECHGSQRQESGLRLDTRAGLAAGGESGAKLLTQSHTESGLIARVTAARESARMPPDGPWLTAADTTILKSWIDQGAPWDPEIRTIDARLQPGTLEKIAAELDAATRHVRAILAVGVLLAVVVLVIERRRRTRTAGRGQPPHGVHYAVIFLVFLTVALFQHHRGRDAERVATIQALQSDLNSVRDPALGFDRFGPVPRRPRHPLRLGGEYYRGNDERDERLYNGGFYRTATFRIQLITDDGTVLRVGDAVPDEPLFIDFQMDRAQGTTQAHFTDFAMQSVFLSNQSVRSGVTDTPVPLTVVEPKWRWRARYQIADASPDMQTLRGRVFVYCSAAVHERRVDGRVHYGIDYTIDFSEGRIQPGSEIWMGSLFQTENVAQPGRRQIPVAEWFDFRAMPEIEGKHTDDPELLGIDRPDGR